MKIVIVNRNFFITGGPEKYMFTLMENMPQHRFIPFCVAFDKNRETPFKRYFVEPPFGQGGVYFSDFKLPLFQKMTYAFQSIYNWEAKKKLERLIADETPHLVLCLNSVYFTDSIIDACRKFKVPVVSRLSDFHRVCANYLLYREGHACDECIEQGFTRAIVNRCAGYQRSRIGACIKVAGMWLSRVRGVFKYIDYFVAPSEFTRQKMIRGGFDPEKVVHIPTMASVHQEPPKPYGKEILFVGRLSPEKGVDVLIEALGALKDKQTRLSIVGDDSTEYAQNLKKNIPERLRGRIFFHGFLGQDKIDSLYERCSCFVVPSVWYENQPNTVLEGLGHGRPAIVSDVGSLREMVQEGLTGLRFRAGDPKDLAAKIDCLLSEPEKAHEMGLRGRQHVMENHSLDRHLAAMDRLFEMSVERKKAVG